MNLYVILTTDSIIRKLVSFVVICIFLPVGWLVVRVSLAKYKAVLAMDDRYFHSAFMYVSFNMPFVVVVCHFCFTILPDSNKRFPLFKSRQKTQPLTVHLKATFNIICKQSKLLMVRHIYTFYYVGHFFIHKRDFFNLCRLM